MERLLAVMSEGLACPPHAFRIGFAAGFGFVAFCAAADRFAIRRCPTPAVLARFVFIKFPFVCTAEVFGIVIITVAFGIGFAAGFSAVAFGRRADDIAV